MIIENGLVAMKYFQQVPQKVKLGKDVYFFTVKANICMAWVKQEHVTTILEIVRTCCGGNKTKPYRLANELDVKRWMNRGQW